VLWPQRGCKQELPAASGPIFRSINKNYFRTFSLQEPAEATPDLHLSLVHSVVKVPPPELHLSICRAWGTLPCTNVKLQVKIFSCAIDGTVAHAKATRRRWTLPNQSVDRFRNGVC
jgi:hypothetical protein